METTFTGEREGAEGGMTQAIEQKARRMPSNAFLWAGVGSIALSLSLLFAGRKQEANFVGQWVPTLLALAIYNKLSMLEADEETIDATAELH